MVLSRQLCSLMLPVGCADRARSRWQNLRNHPGDRTFGATRQEVMESRRILVPLRDEHFRALEPDEKSGVQAIMYEVFKQTSRKLNQELRCTDRFL